MQADGNYCGSIPHEVTNKIKGTMNFFNKLFSCFHKQEPIEFDTSARILFILKYREPDALWIPEDESYSYSTGQLSSGLANSAGFANDFLNQNGISSNLVHAVDNNCIDRLVKENNPTHVIIEAYWVVPEKFEVLTKLHPSIKWIIRSHSHTPFLATEGIAFDWSMKYISYPGVFLACNHQEAFKDMKHLARATYPRWKQKDIDAKILYLPNVYRLDIRTNQTEEPTTVLKVSSFGAIRPLKNQVSQAIAAIAYAEKHGYFLEFHINGTRKEGNGEAVLKNIRSIFAHAKNAKLIEHAWLDHEEFLKLVDTMHIGLQVTYTETFNIVAADLVSGGVPVVVSDAIEWVSDELKADPNNVRDIIRKIELALNARHKQDLCYNNVVRLIKTVESNGKYWKRWP
jgi:glycosyltransferase involved in cell wall biosynthesis